jgi:type II secretory pathway pseudopilin PulG
LNILKSGYRNTVLNKRLETGFSMLEAVVVVGVLLALAVGGFFAYGAITDNAKKAKVKTEASVLYTASSVANSDGDSTTDPLTTINTYNDSTDDFKAVIKNAAGSSDTNNFSTQAGEDFCVIVTNNESQDINSTVGDCSAGGSGSGGEGPIITPVNTVACGAYEVPGQPITSSNTYLSSGMISYMNCNLAQAYSPELTTWYTDFASYGTSDFFKNLAATQQGHSYGLDFGNLEHTYGPGTDLDEKVSPAMMAWYFDRTPENQKAYGDATRAWYEYLVTNTAVQPYHMVADPAHPDQFPTNVTVAAGSKDSITVTVGVPADVELKYANMGQWSIEDHLDQSNFGSANYTNYINGGYRYWTLTLTPSANWDKNKLYTGVTQILDKNGIFYTHSFKITVN